MALSPEAKKKVDKATKRLAGRSVPSPHTIDLIDRRVTLKAKRDEAQAAIDEIDAELKTALKDLDDPIETADWKASLVDSSNRHISKDKLIALGVKPVVIAKATEEKPYSYVKVTVKK